MSQSTGVDAADGHAAGGTGDSDHQDGRGPGDRGRTAITVVAVTGALSIPLVIALVAVRTPQWYPLVDLAQIEMRVRDVGTSHPPLVGLGGRIAGLDTSGSHPGPLSFFALAPVYNLLGRSSWALQVSATTLNVAALGATVWAVHRRAGLQGALLAGAVLALLMRVYGTELLVFPWNPYTPLLFWPLLLVCVWGVLDGDLALLPVAVVAGSVCAQTHLPYIGLVGGLAALVAVALVVAYLRSPSGTGVRARLVRWSGASVVLGVVLWSPPVVQQVSGNPGNVSVIVDSFRHPIEQPVGTATAWGLFTRHLDLAQLLLGRPARALDVNSGLSSGGVAWGGVALLVAWIAAASASVAMRRREPTLVRLHLVVAAALMLGYVSMSRILGATWYYLTLWAYGTAALALGAVVATAAILVRHVVLRRATAPQGGRPDRADRAVLAALGVAVVVPVALLARSGVDAQDIDEDTSSQVGAVADPTAQALADGTVPGADDGTYLVTWVDPVNLGAPGIGLMLELERRGFDVRADERAADAMELAVREHRLAMPHETDAEIHVAAGESAIAAARSRPGADELAYDDPRTDAEIARHDELIDRVVTRLEAAGLDDLVPEVQGTLFALATDERVPDDLKRDIHLMSQIPQPVAVFTWEPTP